MNIASFFQIHDRSRFWNIMKRFYKMLFLRTDAARIKYLRDAGATIGNNVHILKVDQIGTEPCLVRIGNDVFFSGTETQLLTHDGGVPHTYQMGVAPKQYDSFGTISIGDNCFIGIRCIILKGVKIGNNCVIGAGSVVTKDIPDGSVACGVPARVVETVEEYYKKNKDKVDNTVRWNTYKKRQYLEKKYKL